ncbi:MAG: tyrosine-type recombinase/integrase, partial [Candidatus Dormibacterales bacterium]
MSRRGNGEGSIFRRKDGRFEARIFIDGQRRSKCAKTQRELQRWLSEARRARDLGLPLIDSRQTLEAFLTSWLPGRRNQIRHGTWSHQEWIVRRYIVPVIGQVQVARLRPQHVQLMQDRMLEAGLSPTTVHHAHAVLHRALQDAVRWDQAARNVAALVAPPRMVRSEMKTFSREQVQ